ncbi:hypothetical protein BDV32DRAFT_150930 [Aspergillus pseudonomiae]|uniref:Uncharacterized protein n=1 Tax=Aspergillus pseudonomiae TaxID=1506151 RepID=A0A5N6HZJ4_9EURO|nr:uncharacterized protein BDV37DRAFT_283589 [Aspergillus pseudonomiae]KAB8258840.1 hypothetical protein BDV32DRAFT_150930 [Aspergillus pseudonomiae]KAE8403529.1 hypothetical protein BDV37DRAFT_283589 [Aspergillus pseudonomiae]
MPKEQFHTPWTLVGSGPYTYYNLAGVATYFRTTDGGFAYFDPEKPETFNAALSNLQDFIEHEGPFDAVVIVPTGLYQGKDSYSFLSCMLYVQPSSFSSRSSSPSTYGLVPGTG